MATRLESQNPLIKGWWSQVKGLLVLEAATSHRGVPMPPLPHSVFKSNFSRISKGKKAWKEMERKECEN
jgi:hypothetical protein